MKCRATLLLDTIATLAAQMLLIMKPCHLKGQTLGALTGVHTGATHSHYGVPQPP